ncbi:hypothetical protein J1N35_039810 [Gossypium stocksii]|uniref:Uncharacterized protein n=1 Tax=Gossypium stocksii TaxID=47602 RepID=A0A9D3ZHP6_9ROSI|nr:hypothetical protein J1N35_039810 [Gossypium stocksii]
MHGSYTFFNLFSFLSFVTPSVSFLARISLVVVLFSVPSSLLLVVLNYRGVGNPTTVCDLKQLLVANDPDVAFFCETKINANRFSSISRKCRMEGCLAVNTEGKSGGLVMMWKENNIVDIQMYSSNHIDVMIQIENGKPIRFKGFYGNADPNKRHALGKCLEGLANTEGRRLRDSIRDPRLCFKYDICWAKNKEAKKIIKDAWQRGTQDIMEKVQNVGKELGGWQYKKFKQMHNKIGNCR